MKPEKFFALDLELNNKKDGTVPKIIQVGVAIGSPLYPQNIDTFGWYLDPHEPIEPFITQLTGISDQIIEENAVSHETLAQQLGDLITINNCFSNPITWGQGDADELKAEFRDKNIDFPFFGRRIFDVKTIYVYNQIVKGRTKSGGLRNSMKSYGMKFCGVPHNAEDDALNTLAFFFHFLNRQKIFEDYAEIMRKIK